MSDENRQSEPGNDRAAKGVESAGEKRGKYFAKRRTAREWALQLLYALRLSDDSFEASAEHLEKIDEIDQPEGEFLGFGKSLARHAREHQPELDEAIRPALQNWRLERLALIDLFILRLALAELITQPETPSRVILNEYIEIAKDFGSEETPRFVNGILDNLLRQLRPEEARRRGERGRRQRDRGSSSDRTPGDISPSPSPPAASGPES